MADLVAPAHLQEMASKAWQWAVTNVVSWEMGVQLLIVLGAIIPAAIFSPVLRKLSAEQIEKRLEHGLLRRFASAVTKLALPIAVFIVISIGIWILNAFDLRVEFIKAIRSLLVAWIVIRAITLAIRSSFWSKFAFYTVWPLAALNAFGLLDNLINSLAGTKLTLSDGDAAKGIDPITFSALDFIQTIITFLALFGIAKIIGSAITNRVQKVPELSPSLKAILAKMINLIFPILAFVIALQMVGFNLASLAIFGGAVGIGIGLGLQSIVANFMAGLTLLLDKSIKPGDSIQIDDTYGWVTAMNSRYVALRTRDGDDHLVPNDHFMNNGVINRSHGDPNYRIHAPIGVAYGTDLELVQKLCVEAANSVKRVLKFPEPVCLLTEFGDNSINFDIRFWINDVPNGMANVRSQVYMAAWKKFKENNIEIPFPQRDLHLKSGALHITTDHATSGQEKPSNTRAEVIDEIAIARDA